METESQSDVGETPSRMAMRQHAEKALNDAREKHKVIPDHIGPCNVLATHLPDELVHGCLSKQVPFQNTFQAVVMFLDISGFTALSEKYSLNTKSGTDQLTKTLNGYMENLVNEILVSDGDVIKFAGDAILTLWPVKNFNMMQWTVPHVIQCAVNIQKKYGEFTTSVGVKLRVKIVNHPHVVQPPSASISVELEPPDPSTNPTIQYPTDKTSNNIIPHSTTPHRTTTFTQPASCEVDVAHAAVDSLQGAVRSYIAVCHTWNIRRPEHLRISSGETSICYVGNNDFCHYVTMGRSVEAVTAAEKYCESGDIVVSPTAWCHCAFVETISELLDDGKHRKVIDIVNYTGPEYISSHTVTLYTEPPPERPPPPPPVLAEEKEEEPQPEPVPMTPEEERAHRLNVLCGRVPPDQGVVAPPPPPAEPVEPEKEEALPDTTTVRVVILEAFDNSCADTLRLYIAPPVLRKMDEGQPLEYLSEMRQVTIVFINLAIVPNLTKMQLATNLQSAFKIVYQDTKDMNGCLNKIFMFDKGSTFLVIFGLPGYKHENDCAYALKCAHQMKTELDQVSHVRYSSIGVTTGSTFCGVVGHAHRHEYTVIGSKVNMAARLMMYYPNKVTCDGETFHHSKLHKANFQPAEAKEMKGLRNIGTIREFKPVESEKDTNDMIVLNEYQRPLIGRDNEMDYFKAHLAKLRTDSSTFGRVFVIEGDAGMGKTRFLDSITVYGLVEGCRIVSCELTVNDATKPYYTVKSLLFDLLGFSYDMTHQEREHLLYKNFKDPLVLENMALLNDILHLKLPQNDKYLQQDTASRQNLLNEFMGHLIHECAKPSFIIFTVDDADFMDPDSWEIIQQFGSDTNTLLVMTMRAPPRRTCDKAQEVLFDERTVKITLAGIDEERLAQLACQILGVKEVPEEVLNVLKMKSQGVPCWCEQLLKEVLYSEVIKVEPSTEKEGDVKDGDVTYMSGDTAPSYLTTHGGQAGGTLQRFGIPQGGPASGSQPRNVCVVVNPEALSETVPVSIKVMLQSRIDRLEELDQMIVKTASILGVTFYRDALEAILQITIRSDKVGLSLERLSNQGIFTCATSHHPGTSKHGAEPEKHHNPVANADVCTCPGGEGDSSSQTEIGKRMRYCRWLMFQSSPMQETAYEMFLENSRKTLHVAAARFMEMNAHKCATCGGGSFCLQLSGIASREGTDLDQRLSEKLPTVAPAKLQIPLRELIETDEAKVQQTPADTAKETEQQTEAKKTVVVVDPPAAETAGPSVQEPQDVAPAAEEDGSTESAPAGPSCPEAEVDPAVRVVYSCLEAALKTRYDEGRTDDNMLGHIDMRECRCLYILLSVYPELIHHWRQGGSADRTLHFLLEAAAASIATSDNMQAMAFLEDANSLMVKVRKGENPLGTEGANPMPCTYKKWQDARMESLMGQALFHMGQLNECMPHFHNALRILFAEQPKSKHAISRTLKRETAEQMKHIKFPSKYIGSGGPQQTRRIIEQARCLSHISQVYLSRGRSSLALLAALQQLNKAELANTDLNELIMGYSIMMKCMHSLNKRSMAVMYESRAEARCITSMHEMTFDNMISMAHLFWTSLHVRLTWGQIDEAINSGYMATRLSDHLHDNDLRIEMLPVFAQALMLSDRVADAVFILKKLEYTQHETSDVIAKAWYYACSMDLILECGFQLEACQKCLDFTQEAEFDHLFVNEALPLYYLSSCISLWFQRRGHINSTVMWTELAMHHEPTTFETYMAAHGLVKLVENCLIGYARYKADPTSNQRKLLAQTKRVTERLKFLDKVTKFVTVLRPRYLHLEAYCAIINGAKRKSKRLMLAAIKLSESMGNKMELKWLNHNQEVWAGDFAYNDTHWTANCHKEILDWHEAKQDVEIVKYSLPLPQWFA